jgi:hypothetical protein
MPVAGSTCALLFARGRRPRSSPCSGVAGRAVTTAATVLFNSRVTVAVLGEAADLDEAWVLG